MAKPYIVLKERYRPKTWRAWCVGRDLTRLTRKEGLVPLADPAHEPQTFRAWYSKKLHAECGWITYKGGQGEDWHQDGDLAPGSQMDHAEVLWANRTPTEFQYKNKIYQPKPFQVVLVRNLACYHRRPADAPERRWIFRQRIKVPRHIELP